MADAVIVDILRTPFSRSRPHQPERDAFNKLRMDDALSMVVQEIIARNKVQPEEIDDLLVGCALQMRENYLMGGRTIAFLSGLPVSVPAQGTDRVCIRLDRFFIPRVFSLDEDPPRVVVDIPDVRQWQGMSRKPVDGPLVKRIRSYLHRNEKKLRVVLDLQAAESYAVSQTYYRKENLFCIGVR